MTAPDPGAGESTMCRATSPTLGELRRRKSAHTSGFPVYPDLAAVLAGAKGMPDPAVAHVLATLSGYAYADVDIVAMMMTRLGLESCNVLRVGQIVDAMFISSTCYIVQSQDGRVVIVGYRGTEPGPAVSWLTDFDAQMENVSLDPAEDGASGLRGEPKGAPTVHGGFYRNVRATRFQVVGALQHAIAGKSVVDPSVATDHPLQALYITGHSLGGAMAALLGVMTVSEHQYTDLAGALRGVYTFGQPMIGNAAFTRAASALRLPGTGTLGDATFRYVHRRDVVPHLPPWAVGDFAHFGQEYQYSQAGWQHNARPRQPFVPLGEVVLAVGDFVMRQHRWLRKLPFRYSLADHAATHYVTALTPPDRPTEFGDHYFAGPPREVPTR